MSLAVAKNLIRDLKRKGYDSYLVGGVVRDFILRVKFTDIDITTRAKPTDIMKVYKTIPTGLKYGTITVEFEKHKFEVTTFRLDGPTSDFRHPDSVIYSDNVKDDVFRRDFTINGLLMDENHQIIDYVNGREDIENKIIRAIGDPNERFREDALRILRAVYFQAKLGFTIEENTLQAMIANKELIKELAIERIHQELLKTLRGKHLKMALNTLVDTGIDKLLPGLEKGIKYTAKLDTMPFIDTFFTLCFVLNRGIVPDEWPFSNLHRNKYQKASEVALKYREMIDARTLYQYGLEICILANKTNLYLGRSKHMERAINTKYEQLPIKSELDLALTSHEIMQFFNKGAGLWLGKLKKQMVLDILDEKVKNNKEALLKYLEGKEI